MTCPNCGEPEDHYNEADDSFTCWNTPLTPEQFENVQETFSVFDCFKDIDKVQIDPNEVTTEKALMAGDLVCTILNNTLKNTQEELTKMTADRDWYKNETQKAMEAMDWGAEDNRWVPGTTAVDSLIAERNRLFNSISEQIIYYKKEIQKLEQEKCSEFENDRLQIKEIYTTYVNNLYKIINPEY